MGASDVLTCLQTLGVRLYRDGQAIVAEPRSALTDDARALIRAHKAELLAELSRPQQSALPAHLADAASRCRGEALKMLAQSPAVYRAGFVDDQADSLNLVVSVGVRGLGTCELLIPKAKFDGFRLMELIRQYTERGGLTQFLLASETKH